ncbi:MAG: HAMP domain-containing sensor histidine kinase, partial [Methylobacterium sp.]
LRTPLARLRLRMDAIADAELRWSMREEVGEMEVMVSSLLAFLGGEDDAEAASLVDLAVVCATIADDAQDHGHDVRYTGPDHLDVSVRPVGFKRALVNLVDNAIHHAPQVEIRLAAKSGEIEIRIEDDGPGLTPEAATAVMARGRRLDEAVPGDGFGLPITLELAELYGGALSLGRAAGGGLRATLTLPG